MNRSLWPSRFTPQAFRRGACGGLFALVLATLPTLAAESPQRVLLQLAASPVSAKRGVLQQDADARLIAEQQDAVRKALRADPSQARSYRFLPLLALDLDPAGRERALALPEVVAIHEDRLHAPLLDVSAPRVGASAMWTMGQIGSGQVIAVLDTGVDGSHPFLAGKVVDEACFSSNAPAASPASISFCPGGGDREFGPGSGQPCPSSIAGCAHGTHVAGTAAGSGFALAGIARGAQLMALQVFSRFEGTLCGGPASCARGRTSDYVAALEHVYAQREAFSIAAVNLSLGGGRSYGDCDEEPARMAIELLHSAGIASVVANGNDGWRGSLSRPACIAAALAVGAVDDADNVAGFSNVSAYADLLAPGVLIRSSVPPAAFADYNGTSMAAPHVAGAIALLRAAEPGASLEAIERALRESGPWVSDLRSGHLGLALPRLQVDAALARLRTPPSARLLSDAPAALRFSGLAGGPFAPLSYAFELHNEGSAALDWSASVNQAWARLNLAGGRLEAGARQPLQVELDPLQAANLEVGDYRGVLQVRVVAPAVGALQRPLELAVRAQPPPNDDFASAISIAGSAAQLSASTLGAGAEADEPRHADEPAMGSIWWHWLAPGSGPASLSTEGSGFDTLLAVYQGSQLASLQVEGGNDDVQPGVIRHSVLQFNATAGVRYRIAVDGYAGETGAVQLRLQGPLSAQGQLFIGSFEGEP